MRPSSATSSASAPSTSAPSGSPIVWCVSGRGRGYILGGGNVSQDELFALLQALTGRRPPRFVIPFWTAVAAGRLLRAWARLTGRPPAITDGAVATFRHHWIYSSDRAVRELGY